MVRVRRKCPLRAECNQNMRTEGPYLSCDLPDYVVQIEPVQAPVHEVKDNGLCDSEDGTRCGKLFTPDLSQFLIGPRVAPMTCRLAGRHAKYAGLYTSVRI